LAARVTARTVLQRKEQGEKIVMLTAYDFPTAALVDAAGVDAILVGDSLGNVVQGQETTIVVTLDDILYHTKMVTRAVQHALVVADMPFLTYQISPEDSLRNAGRLVQEGGAQAIKLEGGAEVAGTVRRLVQAGIPVMGHIGLTPQSVHAMGFRVQGRTSDAAAKLLEGAYALEDAGAFAVVLELVPEEVSAEISRRLTMPTIGIGSGSGCDGQVLVLHDMLGIGSAELKHNKRYAEIGRAIRGAAEAYAKDVRAGAFPASEQTVSLGADAADVLSAMRFTERRRLIASGDDGAEINPYGGGR
jgi:3-methyl-2-oxobutanoate hydroxymethyltransferase